jgi:hypothetical protein
LVTFYHKTAPFQIKVLKRYLWQWNGQETIIEEWTGDYDAIIAKLQTEVYTL